MACFGMSLLRFDGADDGFCVQGQSADPDAQSRVNGVRDRGGGGSLRGLPGTEGRLIAVDEVYVDPRRRGEPQDRVALPVVAGDPAPVEADTLGRRPAGRLHRAAGQLVAGAVGIDHQPEVRSDGEPAYPQLGLGPDLGDDRAPGPLVLVAGEADAAPDRLRQRVTPTGFECGELDDRATAGVVEVREPEVDRVEARVGG